MPFIGNKPSAVPLTSADIADGIITSAKIVDATIANADIANSTINLTTKVTGTLPVANGGTGLATLGTAAQVLRVNSGATALEYATPSSGAMVFLAETSASNVASVALNGYFTSSYDVYKIYIDGVYGSSTAYASVTFNTTGSYTEQTSSYCFVMGGYRETNANTEGSIYNSGDSASYISFLQAENSITAGGSAEFVLFNPMSTSHYKLITGNISSRISGYIHTTGFCGSWDNTTAITGITFKMSTGNMYARKIRLYGIKNS
jgi:hypothetical protein